MKSPAGTAVDRSNPRLPELFPTNVRYTGSAIAYNVASILGASLAPTIALALWQADGNIFLVRLYLTIAAVVTLVALLIRT